MVITWEVHGFSSNFHSGPTHAKFYKPVLFVFLHNFDSVVFHKFDQNKKCYCLCKCFWSHMFFIWCAHGFSEPVIGLSEPELVLRRRKRHGKLCPPGEVPRDPHPLNPSPPKNAEIYHFYGRNAHMGQKTMQFWAFWAFWANLFLFLDLPNILLVQKMLRAWHWVSELRVQTLQSFRPQFYHWVFIHSFIELLYITWSFVVLSTAHHHYHHYLDIHLL